MALAVALVAASDASATARSLADAAHVCDGTADEVQIIAAANSLPAGGGAVILSEGTFNIDSVIRKAASGKRFWDNVLIEGTGRSTVLYNRQDGAGGDVYTFDIRGPDATDPVVGTGICNLRIKGDEYLTNNKGQHGAHFWYCEDCYADNYWADTLGEEGLVLDVGTKRFKGGRIWGKNLGSSAVDIGGEGTEDIHIESVHGYKTNQVEDTATVQVFGFMPTVGEPSYVTIDKITSRLSGQHGLLITSASNVTVGKVVVEGEAASTPYTANAVRITKSASGSIPTNIHIDQVVGRKVGRAGGSGTSAHGVAIIDGDYITIDQVTIEQCYGIGLYHQGRYSHFGKVTVRDNVDVSLAFGGVNLTASAIDNTIDQVLVRNIVQSSTNGDGVTLSGHRNIIGLVEVSGDGTVTGADGFDIRIGSGALDNIIGSAVLSGHGSGGIIDGGTNTQLGVISKGTSGATYKPYQAGGSDTIASATTSKAVTHGLAFTPTAKHITVTPTNNPTNDPGNIWVSAVGATTFTVNCRADPGATGLTFDWSARVL